MLDIRVRLAQGSDRVARPSESRSGDVRSDLAELGRSSAAPLQEMRRRAGGTGRQYDDAMFDMLHIRVRLSQVSDRVARRSESRSGDVRSDLAELGRSSAAPLQEMRRRAGGTGRQACVRMSHRRKKNA